MKLRTQALLGTVLAGIGLILFHGKGPFIGPPSDAPEGDRIQLVFGWKPADDTVEITYAVDGLQDVTLRPPGVSPYTVRLVVKPGQRVTSRTYIIHHNSNYGQWVSCAIYRNDELEIVKTKNDGTSAQCIPGR